MNEHRIAARERNVRGEQASDGPAISHTDECATGRKVFWAFNIEACQVLTAMQQKTGPGSWFG